MLIELFKQNAEVKVGDIVEASLNHQSKDWDIKVRTHSCDSRYFHILNYSLSS